MIYLKNSRQIDKIRKSGQIAAQSLDLVAEHLAPGMTTGEINRLVEDFLAERGAIAATLGYTGSGNAPPYPASCCVSINDEVVHGIPGKRKLAEGDLVKVDVTAILDGFFGDTARTFMVGKVSKEAETLCLATEKAMHLAIGTVAEGSRLGDIGYAIQSHVEALGLSVVKAFVGHGVGLHFHEAPNVNHYGQAGTGLKLKAGMVFTVEPMINSGGPDVEILDDGWTAVTVDGSLSAQFEHTIAVTPTGHEILTLP
ncbi:MAG: type I methionyl aminopeptidase [Deltaproteobacteria bacterium]|nr:type I methionyl aminopeptidase [Deltaproteobacteria bacterium]